LIKIKTTCLLSILQSELPVKKMKQMPHGQDTTAFDAYCACLKFEWLSVISSYFAFSVLRRDCTESLGLNAQSSVELAGEILKHNQSCKLY
jgi:hypothetical protein